MAHTPIHSALKQIWRWHCSYDPHVTYSSTMTSSKRTKVLSNLGTSLNIKLPASVMLLTQLFLQISNKILWNACFYINNVFSGLDTLSFFLEFTFWLQHQFSFHDEPATGTMRNNQWLINYYHQVLSNWHSKSCLDTYPFLFAGFLLPSPLKLESLCWCISVVTCSR